MKFVDSHTHLDAQVFDQDRDAVIERASQAGVEWIVNIGATDGFEGARRSIELADRHPQIFISVGIHPHDSDRMLDLETLSQLAAHPKVVAIGETGLDFFRDWAPHSKQYEWFEAQVELAKQLKKPLVIHSREAAKECLELLTRLQASSVGGVFHCYSEDAKFAAKLLDQNFIVSFPGNLTFPKAQTMRDAAKAIPLQSIMIETDAPYLAPIPYRGKRCESSFVVEVARQLAQVKKLDLEMVAQSTTQTALSFYGIPQEEI